MRFLFGLLAVFFLVAPARAQERATETGADAGYQVIHQFYAQRNYRPVWTDEDRFTPEGLELPELLAQSARHGLAPESYGVSRMTSVIMDDRPDGLNAWRQAEVFWTYGLWRYATDLSGQPVDAATLESLVDGDVADNLMALAPENPLYEALKERLALLDAEAATPGAVALTKIDFGRPLFRPGMSSPMVPDLRARMVSFGAYENLKPEDAANANFYDPQLVKAVSRFQNEYGLKDDGTIGPVTLGILNRDAARERLQITANMQRLREPHRRLREDRRIEVSIARYWLTAYEDGREAMSMPVVVGQPRRQTISFRTEISGVRLNPTWSVPATIKREDFIPGLLSDPAKLMRKYPVKVVHDGRLVNPTQVDWSQMTPRELMQVSFTQPAGDGNPLGRYRVIMENPYDIYLHDTNHPELFAASMRAQSSGCVRVARPDELAAFILRGKTGWDAQKTADTIKKGTTKDVIIENKIPIYLDYMTAWLNDRRQLILGTDVYGLDKPRYDLLVKNGVTTQRNALKILTRATDILEPELKEAQHREVVLTQSTN